MNRDAPAPEIGVTPLSVTARTAGISASRPSNCWYGVNNWSRGYPLLVASSVTSNNDLR
jgi:hypothetical protein